MPNFALNCPLASTQAISTGDFGGGFRNLGRHCGQIDTGDSAIPPYEGRTESTADTPHESPQTAGSSRWCCVARSIEMKARNPLVRRAAQLPLPPTNSQRAKRPRAASDPGVATAHQPGTTRAEDVEDRDGNKTVAEEYFAVTEKVEALYDQPHQLPSDDEGTEMRKLRGEMHRRMLGNGYCARPVEMDCHFESICESCTFFVTTIEFRPTLQAQREDAA